MAKAELGTLKPAPDTVRWTGETQYLTVPLQKADSTETYLLERSAAYLTVSIPADLLERDGWKGGE